MDRRTLKPGLIVALGTCASIMSVLLVFVSIGSDDDAIRECLSTASLPVDVPRQAFCECYVTEANTLAKRAVRAVVTQEAADVNVRASHLECSAAAYEAGQRRRSMEPELPISLAIPERAATDPNLLIDKDVACPLESGPP